MDEQGILHGFEGFRLTPLQYRFAHVRAIYPENRKFPDWKCLEMAGSSGAKDTLRSMAAAYKALPGVRRIIEQERGKQVERLELSADEVIESTRYVRDVCTGLRPSPVSVMDEDGNSRVVEQFGFNAAGANKSNELLGRHIGMFHDNLSVDDDAIANMPREQRRLRMMELARRQGFALTELQDADEGAVG